MSLTSTFDLPDGPMGLYTAGPTGRDTPALVVLQEIFGVNASMRQVVDHYGAQGYYAVAPDLFWRQAPGIELNPDAADAHAAAMNAAQTYGQDPNAAMADLSALVAHLRERHSRVGIVGYCLGGRMAFLGWLKLAPDAVVSYYGVGLDQLLADLPEHTPPLQMHLGTSDHLIPETARQAISDALRDRPWVELHTYPDAGHAFARRSGKTRIEEAAALADQRALAFLDRHLKPST